MGVGMSDICNNKSGDFGIPVSYFTADKSVLTSQPETYKCQLPLGHKGEHKWEGEQDTGIAGLRNYVEVTWPNGG